MLFFLTNFYIALTSPSDNDYVCLGPTNLFLYWV